jgi:transcriptional regulator with XRE-family HTH domain
MAHMPAQGSHIQQQLGKTIQRQRKIRGLTQEALAEAVNVNRAYIGHIEQGRRTPSISMLEKIAKALKVPVSELF